ncbi:hypothetical protein BS1321_06830 [Peribacillus simplex NBRC 15720 = DSM 1321]|uniref:Uncharacterized protein n=1 Tax=Peribacillus simplex NBRC 15720 = DSM 1321 TaxID=1349754 RepID=A0A223EEN1_9BACI|nr:hypothetical protein BS1321_06830 [Peribacillus simplex NBRC 15720 = DSM 1321]
MLDMLRSIQVISLLAALQGLPSSKQYPAQKDPLYNYGSFLHFMIDGVITRTGNSSCHISFFSFTILEKSIFQMFL